MPKTSFFRRLIKTCEVFESEGELIPGEEHGGGERRRSERLAVSVIALEGAKSWCLSLWKLLMPFPIPKVRPRRWAESWVKAREEHVCRARVQRGTEVVDYHKMFHERLSCVENISLSSQIRGGSPEGGGEQRARSRRRARYWRTSEPLVGAWKCKLRGALYSQLKFQQVWLNSGDSNFSCASQLRMRRTEAILSQIIRSCRRTPGSSPMGRKRNERWRKVTRLTSGKPPEKALDWVGGKVYGAVHCVTMIQHNRNDDLLKSEFDICFMGWTTTIIPESTYDKNSKRLSYISPEIRKLQKVIFIAKESCVSSTAPSNCAAPIKNAVHVFYIYIFISNVRPHGLNGRFKLAHGPQVSQPQSTLFCKYEC